MLLHWKVKCSFLFLAVNVAMTAPIVTYFFSESLILASRRLPADRAFYTSSKLVVFLWLFESNKPFICYLISLHHYSILIQIMTFTVYYKKYRSLQYCSIFVFTNTFCLQICMCVLHIVYLSFKLCIFN